MTKRRWIEYSIAVVVGNAIYFWVLHPGLPPVLQNQPFRFDLGLAIDFACCVLVYLAIRLGSRHARRGSAGGHAPLSQRPGNRRISASPKRKQ